MFSISRVALLLALTLASGCQMLHPKANQPNLPQPAPANQTGAGILIRNNAAALLYDLLNDEKDLSKILLIKHNSTEFGRLVKSISETARDGVKALEGMTNGEPGLHLKNLALPPGETAARKAISKAKEHELLHAKNEEFEFQLLLTQVEALNYGTYLAQVAAEHEPETQRLNEFSDLSTRLRGLREEVVIWLRTKRQ